MMMTVSVSVCQAFRRISQRFHFGYHLWMGSPDVSAVRYRTVVVKEFHCNSAGNNLFLHRQSLFFSISIIPLYLSHFLLNSHLSYVKTTLRHVSFVSWLVFDVDVERIRNMSSRECRLRLGYASSIISQTGRRWLYRTFEPCLKSQKSTCSVQMTIV